MTASDKFINFRLLRFTYLPVGLLVITLEQVIYNNKHISKNIKIISMDEILISSFCNEHRFFLKILFWFQLKH